MPLLSERSRMQQAQDALSSALLALSDLSPQCQEQVTAEIEQFSARLQALRSSAASQPQPGGTDQPLIEQRAGRSNDPGGDRFRGVFDHARIGIILSTVDGYLLDCNPAFEQMIGFTRQELLNVHYTAHTHPDSRSQEDALSAEMLAGKRTWFEVEKQYIRKDGQAIDVRLLVNLLFDAQGKPSMVVSMVDEITDRRQAAARLQQANDELIRNRNRLLAVMQALPIGLAILDAKGGVIEANPEYEAVWGQPRPPASSVSEYDVYQAWHVNTGERVQPQEWAAARAVQNGETVTGQFFEIQKFDGSRGFVLNSGAPVRGDDGSITGAVVAIMDITGRITAERALDESQERFRVALSSLPVQVDTCDAQLRYTWVYHPLRGLTVDDMLGRTDDEILSPEAAAELTAVKQHALDTGQGGVHEVRIPSGEEDTYYVLTTNPVRNKRGAVTGLTCSAIDITGQKKLIIEQQEIETQMLVQRRLMEYREKERQQFARELHDGPIQIVSGAIFHLQVVRQALSDPSLAVELDKAVLNLRGAVRDLRETINDLRPPVIIHFGLTKSVKMYAEDFREKHPGLSIDLDMFEDGSTLSEAVRLVLFRIIQEALNNVVKHAGATSVSVRMSKTGSQVALQICDNGRGFDVEPDLFWRADAGHYGLIGMKERVEAVGGTVAVMSQPGQGATISVIVPGGDAEAGEPPAAG